MNTNLSERLAELENDLADFSLDVLSCAESTKLAYMSAILAHAKKYSGKGSNELALTLLEKAQRAYKIFELSIFRSKII